jgi:hypothetical protein
MALERRKVHFKWLSNTSVIITTPYRQKKFDVSGGGVIDLVNLKHLSDDDVIEMFNEPISSFFVEFFLRDTDSANVGFVYAYANSEDYNLLEETWSTHNNDLTVETTIWVEK